MIALLSSDCSNHRRKDARVTPRVMAATITLRNAGGDRRLIACVVRGIRVAVLFRLRLTRRYRGVTNALPGVKENASQHVVHA